jgi:hypothetical protein
MTIDGKSRTWQIHLPCGASRDESIVPIVDRVPETAIAAGT